MQELANHDLRESALKLARHHAEAGRFNEFLGLCLQLRASTSNDLVSQLELGGLFANFGFVSEARYCYQTALNHSPLDLRAMVNLANLARDTGEHSEARRLYTYLLSQLPNQPVIRRNALTSMEYDPEVTDSHRLAQARAWGEWAIASAGGYRQRPALIPLGERRLRIAYLSADYCQHTVGLFVKDVLKSHDPHRVQIFAYSGGEVNDWVTDEIRAASIFRDVGALSDIALADQIRADGIDVLVDLSGHTAGSRLTVLAYRPAPVMASWLGYFATTGLPYMDAVLLDKWHAPEGSEAQFVEPIVRLPTGRFCYHPVPWAPVAPSAPAFERNNCVTFGCFNNTAKLNAAVFDVWAQVLEVVPDSRLILKWRTFNDTAFCKKVKTAFSERGIAMHRIETRGPSFHADVLQQYSDIDIALDPFPFTGGLTSCESLWMGVPIVTLPQTRVVSRQTHALLQQIGLVGMSARDAKDYVDIAVTLANDRARLSHLRAVLRDKMKASSLMEIKGFTRHLEDTLITLYRSIEHCKKVAGDTRQL